MKNRLLLHHMFLMAGATGDGDKWDQGWTDDLVPDGTVLKHNFRDGRGAVAAVPYDDMGVLSGIAGTDAATVGISGSDDLAPSCTIYEFTVLQVAISGDDSVGVTAGMVGATCTPQPIVIEIDNEVQSMIDHIVPVKAQAFPGQDYEFRIYYQSGYNYVPGDIMTNYGTISGDGSKLIVSSLYDLTARLIMAPDPQGWDKTRPSEKSKQEETDKLLDVVPHEGTATTYKLDQVAISDYFYYLREYNNCPTLITNISSGSVYTTTSGAYNIGVSYSTGYDHNDTVFYVYNTGTMPDKTSGWTETDESVYVHDSCATVAKWALRPDYNADVTLPDGYNKVSYIENRGAAYADLGFKLLAHDKVDIICNVFSSMTSTYAMLFGARTASGGVNAYGFWVRYSSSNAPYYSRGGGGYSGSNFRYDSIIRLVSKNSNVTWYDMAGSTISTINASGRSIDDTYYNCYLYAQNEKDTVSDAYAYGRIYSFKVYNDAGELIHYFVPAVDMVNKKVGLYETVDGYFVSSATSVEFTCKSIGVDDTTLKLTGINADIDVRCDLIDLYRNPTKLEQYGEEEQVPKAIDDLTTSYTLDGMSIEDYFWTVGASNKVGDYCTMNTGSPQVVNLGKTTYFDFTYKTGYEMVDTVATCIDDPDVVLERKSSIEIVEWVPKYNVKSNVIARSEQVTAEDADIIVDMTDRNTIPDTYTVIMGVSNSQYNTYIRTGYIPKAGDTVTCYANVTANTSYTHNCLFGTRNGADGNKSLCLWTRRDSTNVFAYDRCQFVKHSTGVYGYPTKFVCTDTGAEWTMGYTDGSITTSGTVTDSAYEVFLFNRNHSGGYSSSETAYGTIYRFYADSKDGERVVELVPVKRNSDSVIGFYDVVKQVFHPVSSGSVGGVYTVPMYSRLYVSNITKDCNITITKNDDARKKMDISSFDDIPRDTLTGSFTLDNMSIEDYFWSVRVANQAKDIAKVNADTYGGNGDTYQYNTVRTTATSSRFAMPYYDQHDDDMLAVSTNNDAVATLEEAMHIPYPVIPDEYEVLPGLYNTDSGTYFKTGYKPKAGDTVVCYFQKHRRNGYAYYLFGCRGASDTIGSMWFSCEYDSSYQFTYSRCCTRVQGTEITGRVMKLTCGDTGCTYWNGYDTYRLNTSGTITDATQEMYVFGRNANGSRQPAQPYATIYRFTVKDSLGGVVLDLVPARRKEDNVIGFYDNVGDVFIAPSGGSVSVASVPTLYGRLSVTNVTEDTEVTVTRSNAKLKRTDADTSDKMTWTHTVDEIAMYDWFYPVTVVNNASAAITFTGYTYGNICAPLKEGSFTLVPQLSTGYAITDFIVSHGTLTGGGWTVSNVTEAMTVTISLNDWHEAMCTTDDDLGIFDGGAVDFSQYRIVDGDDTAMLKYAVVNGDDHAMGAADIFGFKIGDINMRTFDPAGIPGEDIQGMMLVSASDMTETITTVTVGSRTMYKHTFTLSSQVRLDIGMQYIFKVRNASDTSHLIAIAKNTGAANLVNSNGEYTKDGNVYHFNWNLPNTYIIGGAAEIYMEINGSRL